ncbi:MAG: hypothetical protein KAT11_02950 [Phycisphaerae bacterium]|nr:hypothetical protein [Phycisphaerae bacterium]
MTTAVLRSPRFIAGIVIGLVFGLLSVFWPSEIPLVEQARAQVPDSGAQRNRIVKELESLNGKMDELITLVKSGQIKVRCMPADNKKAGVIRHETVQPKIPVRIPTSDTSRTRADSD